MTHPSNTSVTAQFGAGEREEKTKLVYVKRWRTIVRLPEQYADEIVEALRAAPVSHTSVKDGGSEALREALEGWQKRHMDNLLNALGEWRNKDHEDAVTLARSDVCAILDGFKAALTPDRKAQT